MMTMRCGRRASAVSARASSSNRDLERVPGRGGERGGGGGGRRERPDVDWTERRGAPASPLFVPRTPRQEEYRRLLAAPVVRPSTDAARVGCREGEAGEAGEADGEAGADIVVATGPAGTSKTLGATLVGLEKLMSGDFERLVLTRPAVSADEELGFLPGSLEDKMHVWLLPIMDSLRVSLRPDQVDRLLASKSVEVCSLSHMRGRTFRDAYVIVDECQNTTPSQMLMLLTRIGEGSRFVFTGDLQQHDRGRQVGGLEEFVRRWKWKMGSPSEEGTPQRTRHGMIELFEFDREDVQRHRAIPQILALYDD